jgi:pimeloyl-ACP methyl ester carboxylesterase
MKLYFISGLGADWRVFSFLDLSFCEPVYIDWIEPEKDESLESYALRLRDKIPEDHPTIVGISFGGMLATEMAKADPLSKVIILSSTKTANEFPAFLRPLQYFPFYKWLPGGVIKKSAWIVKWFMAAKGKEQKKLLLQIIKDTDMRFVRWAIPAILKWKNKVIPENVIHIHGTADRVLPLRKVKAHYIIKGGTHAMPMYAFEEISRILREVVEG